MFVWPYNITSMIYAVAKGNNDSTTMHLMTAAAPLAASLSCLCVYDKKQSPNKLFYMHQEIGSAENGWGRNGRVRWHLRIYFVRFIIKTPNAPTETQLTIICGFRKQFISLQFIAALTRTDFHLKRKTVVHKMVRVAPFSMIVSHRITNSLFTHDINHTLHYKFLLLMCVEYIDK